jgi:hypothetical protein
MKSIIRVSVAIRRAICILRYELQKKRTEKRNRVEKIAINEDHKDNKGKRQEMQYVILVKKSTKKWLIQGQKKSEILKVFLEK